MTDCYICGHPILEGQLAMPLILGIAQEEHYKHANPADHLPTLESATVVSEEDFKATASRIGRIERERAARMVEEEQWAIFPDGPKQGEEIEFRVKRLAARIRSGE